MKPGSVVAGRLWYSRDGRGRDDFPMVVCVQCSGVPLARVVEEVFPVLERLEEQLKATAVREAVVSLIDGAREPLRERLMAPATGGVDGAAGIAVRRLASCPELGAEGEGLLRVFHALRDAPSNGAAGAEHVRVPRCAPSAAAGLLDWSRLLEARLGPGRDMLFLAPLAETWIDALVGKPSPSHFYTLRASLKLVPLTTDIAYTIDDRLLAETRAFVLGAGAPA